VRKGEGITMKPLDKGCPYRMPSGGNHGGEVEGSSITLQGTKVIIEGERDHVI